MNSAIATYRAQYREQFIGRNYRGWLHFAFTVSMASTIIVLCALQLHAVTPWEWLTLPLTFVYANFAEYFGHRGPMHHLRPGLRMVYERHTRQHHRFFTETNMAFESSRDFKVVLFPPVLVAFFLFAFGTPIALLLAWLTTPNVGYLFALTAAAYFLNYELLHFAHHLPSEHIVSRLPGMRVLRRLHTAHHDPKLMAGHNFNISYPLGDWVFGTLHRGKE
jgi:hypothetical protein